MRLPWKVERNGSMTKGHVDAASHQHVAGWLVGGAQRRYARIFVDGVELGSARCDLWRPDLKEAGISDGHSGFRFVFSSPPDPTRSHTIEVRDRDDGSVLPGITVLPSLLEGDTMFEFDHLAVATHLRSAAWNDGAWHLTADLISHRNVPIEAVATGAKVEDLKEHPPESILGDRARRKAVTLRLVPLRDAALASLDLVPPSIAETYTRSCRLALPYGIPEYVRLIDHENMSRVSGPTVTSHLFAASGVNTAARLDAILQQEFGKPIAAHPRILDWGVGCGRVALPIKRILAPRSELHGCDVDDLNVNFSRRSFPDLNVVQAPFFPPLPYPDNYFDFVFGISVFTHLTAGAQFLWLSELRRITKPGAPLIMTTHGEYAILNAGDDRVLVEAATSGISDQALDTNLGPKLKRSRYYRATYHTRKYIRETWTDFFDIVRHYSYANVSIQDYVVMRARSS